MGDSLNNKSNRGGVRPGAGRKPGKLEPQTIERHRVIEEFRNRVAKNADRIFNSQMALAEGLTLLFRVDKDSKGKSLPAIQVTDPGEIKDYIDRETDKDTYYFITTKQPDNRALDSMLDRTFGKSESKLILGGGDDPVKLLLEKYELLEGDDNARKGDESVQDTREGAA